MNVGMINNTAFKGIINIHNDFVISKDYSRPCEEYTPYNTERIKYIEENPTEQGCKISAYHANGKFYSDKINLPIEKVLAAYTAANGENNNVVVKLSHA